MRSSWHGWSSSSSPTVVVASKDECVHVDSEISLDARCKLESRPRRPPTPYLHSVARRRANHTKMPTDRFEPSAIKNKMKREEVARKQKRDKRQAKLQRRLAQAKAEAQNPAAKKVRGIEVTCSCNG